MEILYIVFGMWIGVVFTFFQWYRPMDEKIKNLEEGIHDCIKSGLMGPTNNGSIDNDMD
jgi:hypothetical protein